MFTHIAKERIMTWKIRVFGNSNKKEKHLPK